MINEVIDTSKNAVGFATDLFKKAEEARKLNFSKDAIIRQYYVEVCQNLEFIDTLNLANIKMNDESLQTLGVIVNTLNIEMASMILYLSHEKSFSKAFKALRKIKINESQTTDGTKKENAEDKPKNIFTAMLFSVIKINTLRQVCSQNLSDEDFKNLNLRLRILNIYDRLKEIKLTLKESNILKIENK